MGTDLCSEAAYAILSFVKAEGTFQIDGSKLTIEAPVGMDAEKVKQLKGKGGIITQVGNPRKFRMAYATNGKGEWYRMEIEALDPSVQTLEDFLTKLTRRLKAEQ